MAGHVDSCTGRHSSDRHMANGHRTLQSDHDHLLTLVCPSHLEAALEAVCYQRVHPSDLAARSEEVWRGDPHSSTKGCRYLLQALARDVVGLVDLLQRLAVLFVGEVYRHDPDAVEVARYGKGPFQEWVVVEANSCRVEVAASSMGRRSAVVVVAFFPDMGHRRSVGAVDSRGHNRRAEVDGALGARTRRCVHEVAAFVHDH